MFSLFLDDTSATSGNQIATYVILGVLIVAIIVMWILSSRRNKKRQQEAENLINAVKPGHKVKTIGGVCGIVVEVDNEENTFVLETGSESSGKCYMKFDKQAIYQTDAVAEKDEKPQTSTEQPDEPFAETREEPEENAEEKQDLAEEIKTEEK